jgi:hypothetical protein
MDANLLANGAFSDNNTDGESTNQGKYIRTGFKKLHLLP